MQPKRRKFLGRFLTALTWFLVVVHLIPIAWMVYCGFKDNQEILSGKIMPGRRHNDIVFLRELPEGFLSGGVDGSLSLLDKSTLHPIRSKNLGTFATSYWLDETADGPATSGKSATALWVLSSNHGLQEIDPVTLSVRRAFAISKIADVYGNDWATLWINEVSGSDITRMGDALVFSFRIPTYPGFTAFFPASGKFQPAPGYSNKANGQVQGLINDQDSPQDLFIASTSGLFKWHGKISASGNGDASETPTLKLLRGLPASPEKPCWIPHRRIAMAADARAYVYGIDGDSVLAWLDRPAGSGKVTTLDYVKNRLWVGDSRGATAWADTFVGVLTNTQSELFKPDFPNLPGRDADLTSLRVTCMLPRVNGDILLGGPDGVLSLLDGTGKSIASSITPPPPFYIHWHNYVDLWRNIDFGLYLKNSFIVCISVMFLAMLLASLGGYALARYNFPGKNMFGYSVLATQMVPGIMLLLPLYLMFISFSRATGIIVKGSYGGLILTYAAYFVPFSIWILRGFFASLPKELEEAALVDGCGPFQAFFRIIIPSALPGIIATGVYVFLSAWDELMFAWVLTDEKTYTIPVGIRLFVGNFQNRYDLMMAAATVSTLPVMVLFFLMQKHIVSGLTAGAVKE